MNSRPTLGLLRAFQRLVDRAARPGSARLASKAPPPVAGCFEGAVGTAKKENLCITDTKNTNDSDYNNNNDNNNDNNNNNNNNNSNSNNNNR